MVKNNYRNTLVAFMNYDHKVNTYNQDTVFTQEQLLAITPQNVCRYFNQRTYGMEQPPVDALPTLRASTLWYWKKALSSFMVRKAPTWDPVHNCGNPTKSTEVNELIQKVVKHETRGQGAEDKARRPIEHSEFVQQQTLLREDIANYMNVKMYGYPAMFNVQMHYIGRIDTMTQWQKSKFKIHDTFPQYAAKARFNWDKNVQIAGQAPWQIMLGAMDATFCCLVGLGIWLEYYLANKQHEPSPYVFDFSNDFSVPFGGGKGQECCSDNASQLV